MKARFQTKVECETFKSLSRLTTQWGDIVSAMIMGIQSEALVRLEQLIQTVERLNKPSTVHLAEIASDIVRVRQAQECISNKEHI